MPVDAPGRPLTKSSASEAAGSEADRRADREQQARKDEEDRKERAEERKEMFALIARAFSER